MPTAADKVQCSKPRIVEGRVAATYSHYLFNPDFCNVVSVWEKGLIGLHPLL